MRADRLRPAPSSRPRIVRRPIVAPSRVAELCGAAPLAGLGGAGILSAASERNPASDATMPGSDVEPVGEWLHFTDVGRRRAPPTLHQPPEAMIASSRSRSIGPV